MSHPASSKELQKCAYATAESILQHSGFYGHQLSSYENLLSTLIPQIISEMQSTLQTYDARHGIAHKLHIRNTRFCRPTSESEPGVQKAQLARNMFALKLSLMAEVRVDILHELFQQDPKGAPGRLLLASRKDYKNVPFFHIPVMDGSELTHDYDDGNPLNRDHNAGSMVINGYRKTVIIQTRVRTNFPFVRLLKKHTRYFALCETRSAHREKMRSSSTVKLWLSKEKAGGVRKIVAEVPYVCRKMPITVLFRILGVQSIEDMVNLICPREGSEDDSYTTYSAARATLLACPGISDPLCNSLQATQDEIYLYIAINLEGAKSTGSTKTLGSRTREAHIASMQKLLRSEILPHVGSEDDPVTQHRKATFIGMAIRRLLSLGTGVLKPDDQDSCVHKRFTTTGQTLGLKIRQLVKQYCKMLVAGISRCCENSKHVNLHEILSGSIVTRPLRSCLSKGNFSVSGNENATQAGVCQVLNCMNRISRIAHLTTVNQPLSRDGAHSMARQLRPSDWGIICAGHTPDGRSIGLVRHHTLLADFRKGHDQHSLVQVVRRLSPVAPLEASARAYPVLVVVNDEVVARTASPAALCYLLRRLRSNLVLPRDVCISFQMGRVLVQGDEGEAIRPVLRADMLEEYRSIIHRYSQHHPHLVYPELLYSGCLEYVGKTEEATLQIAHTAGGEGVGGVGPAFSHIEIDPALTMFGAVVGLVPFSNHDQGPRIVYFGAMGPQAIGAQHPMFEDYHFDVKSHILCYPQKQISRTITSLLVQGEADHESMTQTYSVAILPAGGLSQEDALVGNAGSFQRGLGFTVKYSTVRDVESAHGTNDVERFMLPPDGPGLVNRKSGSRAAIDPATGFPLKGAILSPGDIVISKVLECKVHRISPVTGKPETVRRAIDRSTVWKGNGRAYVDSVRVVRCGGVRVVLVRMREPNEPEVGNKYAQMGAQKGILGAIWPQADMPFTGEGNQPDLLFCPHGLSSRMTIGMLREMVGNHIGVLEGRSFDASAFRVVPVALQDVKAREGLGMHTFYCGMSGKMIGRGFMCLASYTLQRHLVSGKVHARSTGPRNAITRQPVEGRAHNGGLRLGNMEVATLASVGASETLAEAMTLHDGRDVCVCVCGRVVTVPNSEQMVPCKCGSSETRTIFIPRITLVLYWELLACGVQMRIVPKAGGGGGVDLV